MLVDPNPQFMIRSATAADRDRVNRLLDASYVSYAGPLDRHAEPRPFPGTDQRGNPISYFLAEVEGRDAGVVGVTRAGGLVEWSVPEGPRADAVADALLTAAERWARERGAPEVSLLVPGDDNVSTRAAWRRDYRQALRDVTVMNIVCFSSFLSKLILSRADKLERSRQITAAVVLGRGAYPELLEPELLIEAGPRRCSVRAEAADDPDFRIWTTATEFCEFLLGSRSPRQFVLRSAAVRPMIRWPAALRLVALLAPPSSWFSSMRERR